MTDTPVQPTQNTDAPKADDTCGLAAKAQAAAVETPAQAKSAAVEVPVQVAAVVEAPVHGAGVEPLPAGISVQDGGAPAGAGDAAAQDATQQDTTKTAGCHDCVVLTPEESKLEF